MSGGRRYDGFVPGRHVIDAYGNGGFRFAGHVASRLDPGAALGRPRLARDAPRRT